MIARYPGFKGGGVGSDAAGLHIDNGNNSLLPLSDTLREFGQLGFWVHLEDVDEDQAPLRLLAKEHGRDTTKYEPLSARVERCVCSPITRCTLRAIISVRTVNASHGIWDRQSR